MTDWLAKLLGRFDALEKKIDQSADVPSLEAKLAEAEASLQSMTGTIAERSAAVNALEIEVIQNKKALEAKDAELSALKAELETEKNKAMEALASQGIKGDEIPPAEPQSGVQKNSKNELSELSGLDKVRAAFASQLSLN